MTVRMCPTHPRYPVDNCPPCEAKIAQREFVLADLAGGADRVGEREYERYLDRTGGSR
jgi:hypothetical protein